MLVPLTAACIAYVAGLYSEPVAALVTLRHIEGGQVGMVSHNTNGTYDLGPFQVNDTWIKTFATAWHRSPAETYELIRDHGCANALAGGAILRAAIDEAHGDIGVAIGWYASHTPAIAARYRRRFAAELPKALSGEFR